MKIEIAGIIKRSRSKYLGRKGWDNWLDVVVDIPGHPEIYNIQHPDNSVCLVTQVVPLQVVKITIETTE